MSADSRPVANSVLAALPRALYRRLSPDLARVGLEFGAILCDPGQVIRHVYFPGNCVVSLLTLVEGRLALEVGLVGREGMVGVPLVLGVSRSPVRVLVQGAGSAMRMDAAAFGKAFRASAALRKALYRYTHALMTQVTQTAACNRFHLVEARLARWLLMTRDRARSAQMHLTHEFLSHMLGVRRVGVTEAATALQDRALIEYSRGNITILSHRGLEAASCACYELVRDMQDGASREQPWNRDS
jgi:CRP-like cAMP-binding protein